MLQPDWKTIASELSDIAIRSATPIGEGWTAVAYRVNDELVFKFPKRDKTWEELDREIAFLEYARPRLPLTVAEHLRRVRESAGAPYGYVVYRLLPGDAVEPRGLSALARGKLAKVLGGFLRALHDMNPTPALSVMLPREDEYQIVQQYQREAERHIAPRLSQAKRRRLSHIFERHLDDPVNFAKPPCILHCDLSAEHVLCEGDSVTGILDWGDVCLGDPDYDFGYLYEDFGEDFVREMAAHYGHADPDRLVRKALYFSVADQIGTIVHGGDEALPGDVAASWQRLSALLADNRR